MPYKDKTKRKEYNKKYYETHSEIIKESSKVYRVKHKEKIKEYQVNYRLSHKEQEIKHNKIYYQTNSEKEKELSMEYYLSHKEKMDKSNRNRFLKRKYGIDSDEYRKILESQDYKCAICGKQLNELKRGLYIDHDHKIGKIRGLLCYRCNFILGHAEDKIEILQCSIRYLIEKG